MAQFTKHMGVRITYPKTQYSDFKDNAVQKYDALKEEYADKIDKAEKRVDFYDTMSFIGYLIVTCACVMAIAAPITRIMVENKTACDIVLIVAIITALIALIIAVKSTYTQKHADDDYDNLKDTIRRVLIQSGFNKEVDMYYSFFHFTDNMSEDDIVSHIYASKNVELASILRNACDKLKKKTDSIALTKELYTDKHGSDFLDVNIYLNGHKYDTYRFNINSIDAFLCATKNDDIDLSFIDDDASLFID